MATFDSVLACCHTRGLFVCPSASVIRYAIEVRAQLRRISDPVITTIQHARTEIARIEAVARLVEVTTRAAPLICLIFHLFTSPPHLFYAPRVSYFGFQLTRLVTLVLTTKCAQYTIDETFYHSSHVRYMPSLPARAICTDVPTETAPGNPLL